MAFEDKFLKLTDRRSGHAVYVRVEKVVAVFEGEASQADILCEGGDLVKVCEGVLDVVGLKGTQEISKEESVDERPQTTEMQTETLI